jgi:hypothetical protein
MSSRRQPSLGRFRSTTARQPPTLADRRSQRLTESATSRWRRDDRPNAVCAAVAATRAMRWSRTLIDAVLDELYVNEQFDELMGHASNDLRSANSLRQSPSR